MVTRKIIFAGIIAAFLSCVAVSAARDYTAAVFEHRYRHDLQKQTPKEVIQSNLEYYAIAAEFAAEKGADILIFNEYGLYEYQVGRHKLVPYMEEVPDPKVHRHNPCLEKETFSKRIILSTLSCLARNNQIHIVGNMGDIHHCDVEEQTCDADNIKDCKKEKSRATSCSDDGVLMYNTNVVFDDQGYLIARYHKVHPYFELLNVPEDSDFSTFKTEFGTFGLIVCFDCIFKDAVDLVEKYNIDTMIFPTFWFDDIAPFNAPELQQSWALANKVNFLAANTQTSGNASLGSGIYSKDNGAVIYTYEPDGESKLLVANIGGKPSDGEIFIVSKSGIFAKSETGDKFPEQCYDKVKGPPTDMATDYTCYKSQTENHELVKLTESEGKVSACDNGFCCSVKYSTNGIKNDYYLAVKNFINDVKGFYHWCEQTCMLVRCDPFDGKECVLLPSTSNTVFSSVELTGDFTAERVYATVSTNKYRLAPKSEWHYEIKSSRGVLKYESDSNEPLLKVGFFGRAYSCDPLFKTFY